MFTPFRVGVILLSAIVVISILVGILTLAIKQKRFDSEQNIGLTDNRNTALSILPYPPMLHIDDRSIRIRDFLPVTGEWNTYQNITYRYKVKYPKGWSVEEQRTPLAGKVSFVSPPVSALNNENAQVEIAFEVYPLGSDETLKNWLRKNSTETELVYLDMGDVQFLGTDPSVEMGWENRSLAATAYSVLPDGASVLKMVLRNRNTDFFAGRYMQIFYTAVKTLRFEPNENWVSYRSEKYEYEVKYPKGWIGTDTSSSLAFPGLQELTISPASHKGDALPYPDNANRVIVRIIQWKSVNSYIENMRKTLKGIQEELMIVNGYPAKKIVGIPYHEYIFERNSKVYIFDISVSLPETQSQAFQILSTFRFIDK